MGTLRVSIKWAASIKAVPRTLSKPGWTVGSVGVLRGVTICNLPVVQAVA